MSVTNAPEASEQGRKRQVKGILAGLKKAYPEAECALTHATPLQLLIATILSAQCTDKRVNLVTPDLFRKYVPPPISWTDKTHHTQPDGCKASRTVEVFAVVWDQQHLDRTQRVLQTWTTRDPVAAKTPAAALRQAIAEADWHTLKRHAGLDAVVDMIDQAASAGAGWIDDIRLRGSRTWRRMGGHLSDGGWLTQVAHQVAHAFDHPNASLSEGGDLAVVVQVVPGNPHWKRIGTDSRVLCGKA